MLFVIAVVLGIALGLIVPYNLTSDTLPYVAVAIIAALDSIFGGVVANYSKRFSIYVFMTGLISNAVLAVVLTYVGNMLGINLSFAAIVVFGVRIFNNLANIRRATIDKYFLKRVRNTPMGTFIGIEGSIADGESGSIEAEEKIAEIIEEKLEEKLEEKVGEKVEEKVEEKLEEKVEEKVEEKLEEKIDEKLEEKIEEKLMSEESENSKQEKADK